MYNRSEIVKKQMNQINEDQMWSNLLKEDYIEYFKIYDKVLHCQFNLDLDLLRVPVTFFLKGTHHMLNRSVLQKFDLKAALHYIFPHLFDQDRMELLPKFHNLTVKLAGAVLSFSSPIKYLYECFKSIDGVLYLTICFSD